MKPILCLDFDGVIHSYTSRWQGASVIPDPPVPGALEFIVKALEAYEVAIFSSRSHQWGGKSAMRRWMVKHLLLLGALDYDACPLWWRNRIAQTAFAEPWPEEVLWAATKLVKEISWPYFKPPAKVTIDDRALTFTGVWPDLQLIDTFTPWNKHPPASAPGAMGGGEKP